MSRGKLLSLEEARKGTIPGATLDQFAKEYPSQADGRFWPLLDAMARGKPLDQQTSSAGISADCSGTQTPPNTSEGNEG